MLITAPLLALQAGHITFNPPLPVRKQVCSAIKDKETIRKFAELGFASEVVGLDVSVYPYTQYMMDSSFSFMLRRRQLRGCAWAAP